MNRRKFLTGLIAAPLIVPAARLEMTDTLIRRPEPPLFTTPQGRIFWKMQLNSVYGKPGAPARVCGEFAELQVRYYQACLEMGRSA